VAHRDFFPKQAFAKIDTPDRLEAFMREHNQPTTEEDLAQLGINSYTSFLEVVMPDNRDFVEIALNR